ncbi:neprilysin-4-like [Anastrepha ludens]|uniref:neprilysin-4-like n=1 Tax=Anastrepha ludens TaxID=28586 RepID=UPI0023B0A3C9|nr:neprilysin-4-like [Anastrepha ludens]
MRTCTSITLQLLHLLHLLAFHLSTASAARSMNRQQLKTIERYMDPSADPCNDYYQYACGNWQYVHADAEYYETIGLIDYKVDQEYAQLLNSVRRRRRLRMEHTFVRKLLDYYKSCLTVYAYTPQLYLDWLQEHEQLIWPTVLPSASPTRRAGKRHGKGKVVHYDWLNMLAVLRKYGMNAVFIEETVIQRRDNARASAIDLDKPVLNGGFQPMPHKGFELIMEYLRVTDEQRKATLWDALHEFEAKLKSLDFVEDTTEEGEESASAQRETTLAELNMPFLTRYLDIILERPVDPYMKLTIQNLPYMRLLLTVLDEHEPEFICRYLMLRFLWYLNIDGPRNFLKGDCVSHTRSMMPLAMTWLYERQNPELIDEKSHIEMLFRKMLQHFTQTLHNNANQFDAHILRFLQDKIDTMRIKVGNLPRPATSRQVETFYAELEIEPREFYANHLRLLQHFTRAKHKRLEELLVQDDSFFHLEDPETGASSSPYYLLRSNVVIVPLTLLHTPIYHPQLHEIFKYSSLGFLLSHEITHGFDDSGVEFDKRGNMRGPSDRIKSNRIFDSNLNCLRSRNPQIVDEKIADVSGLRWAYEAYFNSINASSNANARPLHFTSLSPEHVFFLNFAQFFCGSPATSARELEFSEHGSDKERVLDALANFAEFGRVYDCPMGSRMNPQRKCQLWR